MKTLTLFLMTEKGYRFLADTVDAFRPLIRHVVIGRDTAVDDDFHEQIQALCELHGIPWSTRTAQTTIDTDYAMAVGWRWMVTFPEDRLIVFHDSLLPKYRGFNPLVTALINGDAEVGVTALFGAARYDAGPIVAQARVVIDYPCTIAQAIKLIAPCYASTGAQVFEALSRGETLVASAQDETGATYSLWRDDADYRIDWSQSAQTLRRFIDAVGSPYAGAQTKVNGQLAVVDAATPLEDVHIENRVAGKVLWMDDACPVVVCGVGLLKVTQLRDAVTGNSLLPLERFRARFS